MKQNHLQRKADADYLRYESRNVRPSWQPAPWRRTILAFVIACVVMLTIATIAK